jgi:hypothetical protein
MRILGKKMPQIITFFYATVDRKVDDHNYVQDIVEQEDDAVLEHDNLQFTKEQEQHNRIQRICTYSKRIHRIYPNSERIQILHTCYFSISLRAARIDGRLRTASISLVREQPPHDQWLPPQLLQHENSLLQIFPVPDPDLVRSTARRTRFQPRGHVPCTAPAALWYSKISVGELEQELEEQWGEKRKVT